MTLSAIAALLFIGANALFALGRKHKSSESDYILAGRTLGGFTLLATLAASNLSAFTIFGVSGAGYRTGWAFFPVMAFGTGFMALSFAVIGIPLRRLSAAGGWTTPAHFISARFGSRRLGAAFSALSLLFTLPYLAIQAGAAGSMLSQASGLPAASCSGLIVGIIALYVFRGGMRSVANTDILQFIALMGLGIAAFVIIAISAKHSGTWAALATDTSLGSVNSRTGKDASMTLLPVLGYYALWSLADPMFPHFIQRFYAAKSDKALLGSMMAYPFIALLIFLPMTAIGVLGSGLVPGLSGSGADKIFTILAEEVAGPVWGPVFTIAALAALMSTMDSQLLSCASILVEDFFPKKNRSAKTSAWAGLALSLGAWLISLKPPASILGFLNSTAFSGYAILAPVALAAIYLPKAGKKTAALALAAGFALVCLESLKIVRLSIPTALFNAGIQALILAAGYFAQKFQANNWQPSRIMAERLPFPYGWLFVFGGLLIAALDWWNMGKSAAVTWILPDWVWYHAFLCVAMGAIFIIFARIRKKASGSE